VAEHEWLERHRHHEQRHVVDRAEWLPDRQEQHD